MHFTSNQKKAILFIATLFLLAVVYNLVDKMLHPVEAYDFSQFEARYYARLDSIQKVLAEESAALESSAILAGGRTAQQIISEDAAAKSQKKPVASATKKSLPPGQLININAATVEELLLLPRIGPKTAAKIVEYRNLNGSFAAKKDITKVKGIGAKTYEKLKDLITVE